MMATNKKYFSSFRPRKTLNKAFYDEMKQYVPRKEIKRLYAMVISEAYHGETKEMGAEKKQVLAQIKDVETKLSNARELIASKKIDEDYFRELKKGYQEKITRLEKKRYQIANDTADIDGLLDQGIEHLLKLDEGCKKGDFKELRGLVAAIYPENFVFDGQRVRTTRMNISCILFT